MGIVNVKLLRLRRHKGIDHVESNCRNSGVFWVCGAYRCGAYRVLILTKGKV